MVKVEARAQVFAESLLNWQQDREEGHHESKYTSNPEGQTRQWVVILVLSEGVDYESKEDVSYGGNRNSCNHPRNTIEEALDGYHAYQMRRFKSEGS